MIIIRLNELKFNSFHGIHEEERILGNDYSINVSAEFNEEEDVISSIHDTINYVDIYNIIKVRMSIPTPLLETVIMEIGHEIHAEFPRATSIDISITKMHPPIEGIEGSASVSWQRQFK